MRAVFAIPLLFAAVACADDASDRAAIERVIGALTPKQITVEFKLSNSDAPMSEMTPPRILIHSIGFVTQDVALVDAAVAQYGSQIMARKIPVLLVVKKEAESWRILAIRVLATHETVSLRID